MLLKLFLFFTKLGFLSIGGGYPMMRMILEQGVVVGLTTNEFLTMSALELLASGPIVVNAATYIGYIKAGFLGAIVATIGVSISSFSLTTIVFHFISKFKDNPYLESFLDAVKIACGGVLLATALTLGQEVLLIESGNTQIISWAGILIFVVAIIGLVKYKINPIKILFICAFLGLILF